MEVVLFVTGIRLVERRPEKRLDAVGLGSDPVRRRDGEDEARRLVGFDAAASVVANCTPSDTQTPARGAPSP